MLIAFGFTYIGEVVHPEDEPVQRWELEAPRPAGAWVMLENSDSPHVLILPPLLYLLGFAVGFILHLLAPHSIVARPLAYLIAIALLIAGIALGIWARMHLKRRGTSVDPRRPTTALVTDGPYRYSRNPLYLRVTLLYLSFSFFVNDVWLLAVLPLVLIVLHVGVISREERYLEAKFGDEYRAYKARVRRWL